MQFKSIHVDDNDMVILTVEEEENHKTHNFFIGLNWLKDKIKEGLLSNNSIEQKNCKRLEEFLKENCIA